VPHVLNLVRASAAEQASAVVLGPEGKETTMPELLIDFITSLDGYAAAEGWPGWWGPFP
jgi:hypothetical protein